MYYDINKLIMDAHYTIQLTSREEREIRNLVKTNPDKAIQLVQQLSSIRDEYEANLKRINDRIRLLKLELKYGQNVDGNAITFNCVELKSTPSITKEEIRKCIKDMKDFPTLMDILEKRGEHYADTQTDNKSLTDMCHKARK